MCSTWPGCTAVGSCLPRRLRFTAIRWSIRSAKSTGAMSRPSVRAVAMTRPSGLEALCMIYARSLGVDVRLIRIFNTYGPNMDPEDGRMLPNFITQALANLPLTIYGDGQYTRSLCYVDDTLNGLLAVMESNRPDAAG